MAFETLDLPRIYAAAEQLKGARRQSRLDDLREMGLQAQLDQNKTTFDQGQQDRERTLGLEKAKTVDAKAGNILAATDAKAYITANEPDLIPHLGTLGIDFNTADDATIREKVEAMRNHAREALGVGPAPKLQDVRDESGALLQLDPTTGKKVQVVAPQKPDRPSFQHVVLDNGNIGAFDSRTGKTVDTGQKAQASASADTGPLVQITGPDGKPIYATRDEAKGKPAYVARDKPAAADLKYQRELQSKQPRLEAAIRRVNRLADAVDSISKNKAFDGGPLDQYALGWTEQGQEIEQSIAALTPEITALTRVPGIGSQSDLESRMAALQFPSARFSPDVNRKAVAELKAFMSDLKDVYGTTQKEADDATSVGTADAKPSAPSAPPSLQPGSSYKHTSGATVTILPD
jgi:hypothetical protein